MCVRGEERRGGPHFPSHIPRSTAPATQARVGATKGVKIRVRVLVTRPLTAPENLCTCELTLWLLLTTAEKQHLNFYCCNIT